MLSNIDAAAFAAAAVLLAASGLLLPVLLLPSAIAITMLPCPCLGKLPAMAPTAPLLMRTQRCQRPEERGTLLLAHPVVLANDAV